MALALRQTIAYIRWNRVRLNIEKHNISNYLGSQPLNARPILEDERSKASYIRSHSLTDDTPHAERSLDRRPTWVQSPSPPNLARDEIATQDKDNDDKDDDDDDENDVADIEDDDNDDDPPP